MHEQWLSAGAALGRPLLAAHALGYGAIMLSGERCQDEALRAGLGLETHETLAGFISIGAIAKSPPPAKQPDRERVFSAWAATASGAKQAETQMSAMAISRLAKAPRPE